MYVRTKASGICVMMLRDLARLKPSEVELWNGFKWVQLQLIVVGLKIGPWWDFIPILAVALGVRLVLDRKREKRD